MTSQFVRTYRHQRTGTPADSDTEHVQWLLAHLSFLIPYVGKERSISTEIPETDHDEEAEEAQNARLPQRQAVRRSRKKVLHVHRRTCLSSRPNVQAKQCYYQQLWKSKKGSVATSGRRYCHRLAPTLPPRQRQCCRNSATSTTFQTRSQTTRTGSSLWERK